MTKNVYMYSNPALLLVGVYTHLLLTPHFGQFSWSQWN